MTANSNSLQTHVLTKSKFFRGLIRNTLYSIPDFTDWFIGNNLGIRNVKYCGSVAQISSFSFVTKIKKTIKINN